MSRLSTVFVYLYKICNILLFCSFKALLHLNGKSLTLFKYFFPIPVIVCMYYIYDMYVSSMMMAFYVFQVVFNKWIA